MSKLKKVIKEESNKIIRKKNRKPLKETKLTKIIREEVGLLLKEAKENGPDIHKKLKEMRKNLIKEAPARQRGVSSTATGTYKIERRIPVAAVAEILDVPVSELVIHLINNHKNTDKSDCLVEYRLGMVCFYGIPESQEIEVD